jgi:hypothetical protein
MSVLSLCEWIQETALSIAIRESLVWYPLLIALHVMGTVTAVGLILALDIRLLGWGMQRTPISAIFKQLRPWAIAGFGYQIVTGVFLFWSEPVKCYGTPAFWIKMVAMFLAFGNAILFDRTVYPTSADWDQAADPPFRAKFAGAASLVLWAVVIWGGRWTAYA